MIEVKLHILFYIVLCGCYSYYNNEVEATTNAEREKKNRKNRIMWIYVESGMLSSSSVANVDVDMASMVSTKGKSETKRASTHTSRWRWWWWLSQSNVNIQLKEYLVLCRASILLHNPHTHTQLHTKRFYLVLTLAFGRQRKRDNIHKYLDLRVYLVCAIMCTKLSFCCWHIVHRGHILLITQYWIEFYAIF